MALSVQTSYSVDPAIGYAGQPDESYDPADGITLYNAEASASIPFGAIVAFKPSGTVDKQATLPANSTDVLAGVVVKSHAYAPAFSTGGVTVGNLDSTGIVVGATMNVAREGRFLLTCADGCVPGNHLFVRYAGGTKGEARSTDAGGSTCIDATTRGTWLTTATAGNLAWISLDFDNK